MEKYKFDSLATQETKKTSQDITDMARHIFFNKLSTNRTYVQNS